jgi:glutathione S-transferase
MHLKLYYFLTPTSRKACAVAKHLGLKAEYQLVDLAKGDQHTPEFRKLNPNGRAPVLVDGERVVWESNAIMCYLADKAGSDLFPRDERLVEAIRWLSYDLAHFSRFTGLLFFERLVKPRLNMGPTDEKAIEEALGFFRRNAVALDQHLAGRAYVVGTGLTVVDFALAAFLPHAQEAGIPLSEFPHIARWHDKLMELPAWADPFPT